MPPTRPAFRCPLYLGFLLALGVPGDLGAGRIDLQPPPEGEFVVDAASLVEPADRQAIREVCHRLLRERATPILVVTIASMEDHAKFRLRGMTVESFARLLFD
ncbi:MAG: TPM domain-containing protein [Planctomycetota bacterium]|nr:TPM domain-containing protein [Planctomycetota bacterium]